MEKRGFVSTSRVVTQSLDGGDVKSDAVTNSKNPVKANIKLLCVRIKTFGFIYLNRFRF